MGEKIMVRFIDKYKINSSRLIGWNYSKPGNYFITICTYLHNNYFGKIENGKMLYKPAGKICVNELLKTFDIRKNLKLIAWVVMPNHVHLLIMLRDLHVETPRGASLQDNRKVTLINFSHKNHPGFYSRLNQKSNQEIPKAINQFKSMVTNQCKKQNLLFGWQTRFFDEVVNTENKLKTFKYYIKNNPENWQKDKLYN